MPQKITDAELMARVEQELRSAQDYIGGKLSAQRQKALRYYLAQPEGDLAPPEVEGRSSFVSADVADTVEWMLPSQLRIFTASDRVVQLSPRKPGTEQTAEDATDYLNWIFGTQNDGFKSLYTMFKDALISKVGVLKVWWDDRLDEAREEYHGLSDAELTQLLDDEEVEPIEHSARPDEKSEKQRQQALEQLGQQLVQAQMASQQGDQQAAQAAVQLNQQIAQIRGAPPVMVHDVTCKRVRRAAQVRIEPVPPEEFFISRAAKRIADAPFVAHVVERSISDLRAQGFDIEDAEMPSDESGMIGKSAERVQRWNYDDSTAPFPNMMEPPSDPSMRRVWVVEAYLRADVNGDGIAEWRRVLKVGRRLLENTECDGPPFVAVTPVPLPHRFFGQSVADLAMETQKHKTAMIRAIQDNLYLQVNGRYFAVEGQVNLDDLLTSRPGGVVRVKQPGAVGALQQGIADMADTYQLLEYMEVQKENRTGFTRYSQGADSQSLNKTATGIGIITNRSDMRTELVARVFAETGVRDLFVRILQLVCQYQDAEAQFMLNGRWLNVNPREWRHQFDVMVNVGLGTNDPQARMAQITQLMQMQQQLFPLGIVSPAEAYNAASELVKALGYKNAERFLRDPQRSPPPPPPPDPALQVEQMRQHGEAQRAQLETQREAQRSAQQLQIEQARLDAKAASDAQARAQEAILAQQRVEAEAQTKVRVAEINAAAEVQKAIEVERIRLEAQGIAQASTEQSAHMQQMLAQVIAQAQQLHQAVEAMAGESRRRASARIVRDAQGRVAGTVDASGAPIAVIERDQAGRVMGLGPAN